MSPCGRAGPGVAPPLISQSAVPAVTVAPTSAEIDVTVPALCALIGCSIFMASSTTIRSPTATSWPSSTATLTIVPCIGAVSESPDAAEPAFLPPPRLTAGLAPVRAPPDVPPEKEPPLLLLSPKANPAGSDTSSRLPPTSTTTFSRSPASAASPAAPQ